MTGETAPIVLLDRIVDGVIPEYCLHGRVQCVRCHQWCHLGHQTERVVTSGEASPLCMDCVTELREAGLWPEDARPTASLQDNRRADGPHELDVPAGWVEVPCSNPTCRNLVWAPPVDPPAATVIRVCSTACAEAMTDAYTSLHKP